MMRALFHFACEGEILAASIDKAEGSTGIICVTGGTQTRFGAHRGNALLAARFAAAGYPVMRFDRRGVGDSSGQDPGFADSGADLAAAIAAFRVRCPSIELLVGYGLCDGATTLCLHHAEVGIDALLLTNPWVVEAAANEPPPAAIGKHYRKQLLSLASWKRLLSGGIDYRKALRGVFKLVKPQRNADSLAATIGDALAHSDAPAHLVIAEDDATGVDFDHEWRKGAMRSLSGSQRFTRATIATDAHSFAREGDFEQLAQTCLEAIARFEASSA